MQMLAYSFTSLTKNSNQVQMSEEYENSCVLHWLCTAYVMNCLFKMFLLIEMSKCTIDLGI